MLTMPRIKLHKGGIHNNIQYIYHYNYNNLLESYDTYVTNNPCLLSRSASQLFLFPQEKQLQKGCSEAGGNS